jgi:hypothetical protein
MAFLFNEISLQNHVSSFIIIHCIIVKGMVTMTTILYKNSVNPFQSNNKWLDMKLTKLYNKGL